MVCSYMKLKFASVALVAVLMSLIFIAPMSAEAKHSGSFTTPVTGTVANGTFDGTATITKFVVQNGQLMAVGTLSGTATQTVGGVTTTTEVPATAFTAPVAVAVGGASSAAASSALAPAAVGCNILTLDIGAIHLDLLGLVVDLAPINLDITAVPGAGNLLGNLLCAVANLLNNGGPLTTIANLLNQILGILNGLTLP